MDKSFRLASDADMETILNALDTLELDGSHVIKITDKKEHKSARQRRYQWLLYNTIAKSGKGSRDLAVDVDADCKWQFRDIFFADDAFLHDLYALWIENHPNDVKWFCQHHLHTESLNTKQMANYLDNILSFYGREIDLPMPSDIGLLDY